MCWQTKALTSFDVKNRGRKGGKCRKCVELLAKHGQITSKRLKIRLESAHSKKPQQEWVDFDARDALKLEGLICKVSDEKVKNISEIEDLLNKIVSAYGGIDNMCEVVARDIFSEDVQREHRMRHHRLLLAIIASLSKVKAAKAAERERVKLARAVNSSSVEDMPDLKTDDIAMRDAALPIVALAKHDMLSTVVHWLLDNKILDRREFGI